MTGLGLQESKLPDVAVIEPILHLPQNYTPKWQLHRGPQNRRSFLTSYSTEIFIDKSKVA